MENHRFVISLLFVFGLSLPAFGFAYSDKTTHPALTQEIIKFYNQNYPRQQISDADRQLIMRGSIDEDSGTRWLHHFYDPVRDRGLVMGAGNDLYESRKLAMMIAATRSEWKSAKEWAQSTESQAGMGSFMAGILRPFFSSDKDYSWDRAIYEYAWGDRKRGLLALGHVLHLLEDMTVPDHTRNDPHPPYLDMGSPYESWAAKFSSSNITVNIYENDNPILLHNLDSYFDDNANFSNKNFFSKDSIFKFAYSNPTADFYETTKLSNGLVAKFGYKKLGNKNYKLVREDAQFLWKELVKEGSTRYFITDDDDLILNDYWTFLSTKAVLNGAGVVKFFFDEVEKEKQTKALYEKNRSWLGKIIDRSKERIFNVASVLYGISVPYDIDKMEEEELAAARSGVAASIPQTKETIFSTNEAESASITSVPNNNAEAAAPDNNSRGPAENFGASVEAEAGVQTEAETNVQSSQSQPQSQRESAQPLGVGSQQDETTQELQSIAPGAGSGSSGGSSGGINGGAPANPAEETPSPAEATTTPSVSEEAATSTPAADTAAPDISLSVEQCANSLSSDGCLLANTSLTISWTSLASDLDRYAVECSKGGAPCSGFAAPAPTATSTSFAAEDNAAYVFQVTATDASGNSSQASQSVEINSRPIVINEVAWAGTGASASDEWIELKNRTGRTLSLEGWLFRSATDNKPYLNLSGNVSPNGYYLIERTNDDTVSGIAADLVAAFGSGTGMGLSDGGEMLVLEYASTTIDQTPQAGACGSNPWCGGNTADRKTMERIDPALAGSDGASWGTNDGTIRNGQSASGAALNATPKARNSRNHYVNQTGTLSYSLTLTSAKSPYFIDANGLTINVGATLTIEPGVVIKIGGNAASITVNGVLKALGSAANPIIFTSFADDEYGGDMNGDGDTTVPGAGSWRSIVINSSSVGSEFSHALIRYGGKWYAGQTAGHALLKVDGASVAISNSIFEYSLQYGIWLVNSASTTIANSTVRNNAVDGLSYGVYIDGGSPTIENSAFDQNRVGARLTNDAAPILSGNTFTGNIGEAISAVSSAPGLSMNTAAGNGVNGMVMTSTLIRDYTFSGNLPFVFDATLGLLAGRIFTAPAGAIFKGKSSSATIDAYGVFRIAGTAENPVIFTSWKDDAYGGDTNNDGALSSPTAEDWRFIQFSATASSSEIAHAVVRYGGVRLGSPNGAVNINSAAVNISDTVFEHNLRGLELTNATSTLSNLTFRDHQVNTAQSAGLVLTNSQAILSNSEFTNNKAGIVAGGSVLSDGGGNSFLGNTTDTIPSGLFP